MLNTTDWVQISNQLDFFVSIKTANDESTASVQYKLDAGKYYIKLIKEESTGSSTHAAEFVNVLQVASTQTFR